MTVPHNIYVHVPFCMSKCNYCAFFSRACANPDWDLYTAGIVAELKYWERQLGKISIPTIFFGGGTPSLMPVQSFRKIIHTITTLFDTEPDCEITLESNPRTLDATKLDEFCAAGVNRLSIGIQSLSDERLQFLGRQHSVTDALHLVDLARRKNIRLSADFIYGMPNDTVDDIVKLCDDINALGLGHCSMYELTIEENTPFGKMNLNMPTNDEMAQMYIAIGDRLNIPRYEVSNYATHGNECRHNMNIWDGAPYIGIGRGGAGRVLINNQWYEQMGNGELFNPLDHGARAIERVITGMRMVRGVILDNDTEKIINMDFVNSHPDLVYRTNDGRIAATKHGMLILDDVIANMTRG